MNLIFKFKDSKSRIGLLSISLVRVLKLWVVAMLSAQMCVGAIVESFADLPTAEYDFIVVGGMTRPVYIRKHS
jgi:hypothetical protein